MLKSTKTYPLFWDMCAARHDYEQAKKHEQTARHDYELEKKHDQTARHDYELENIAGNR